MTDSSPADTRPSRMSVTAGPGLAVVCAVWGIGLLILCGGALATCWRMIEVHKRQQQAQLQASREFHGQLIQQMQTLAGHSAASVTSDLCRVRFRLRLPEKQTPPAGPYRVVLRQNPGPDEIILDNRHIPPALQQVADFGLLAPGRYQLMIEDRHRMHCFHDFEVEPGSPVDRVAYCPDYESWMLRTEPAQFRLRFDWPPQWDSHPIVTVVHLRNGSVSNGDWCWQPPEAQQFDACVVISRDGLHGSWDSACRALPKCLTGKLDLLPVVMDEDDQLCVVVPYACCEVYGVSFLLAATDESTGYRHLETILYDGPHSPPHPDAGSADEGIVLLSRACCRQVCTGPEPVDLPIPLPELIVPSVLYVAEHARPAKP